eukprot:663609-Pleurochrysis_carterae.AAC.1
MARVSSIVTSRDASSTANLADCRGAVREGRRRKRDWEGSMLRASKLRQGQADELGWRADVPSTGAPSSEERADSTSDHGLVVRIES